VERFANSIRFVHTRLEAVRYPPKVQQNLF